MLDIRVGTKYRLGKKIGSGSFGSVFLGTNIQNNAEVAVKLEDLQAATPQLAHESKVLKIFAGTPGIPEVYWSGAEGAYSTMILELLGASLEDLFNFANRRFSLKTVLMLADQVMGRVESVHSKLYIHRDIKPDNFLIGLGKSSNLIYLIDFGLAKKYKDSATQKHIVLREGKKLTGNARYSSLNVAAGLEASRRDEVEAVGLMLVYFLKGGLPWQGLPGATKEEKYRNIRDCKTRVSIQELCSGLPSEIAVFLSYCRALQFEDRPDYMYLRKMLKELFVNEGFDYDFIFDWTLLNYSSSRMNRMRPVELQELDESRRAFYSDSSNEAEENRAVEKQTKQQSKCAIY